MAGRCPDELEARFLADVSAGLTGPQLATKYERVERTITEWKRKLRDEGKLHDQQEPPSEFDGLDPEVIGLGPDDGMPDEEELWGRAYRIHERHQRIEAKRREQHITIPGGKAFGWAWLSDLHFGGTTDYRQIRADAELIRDTDRMWCSFNGDGLNNWIVGKLARLQRNHSLSHDDEWHLFGSFLRIVIDKLKVVVMGNHELWTMILAGVNPVRSQLSGCRVLFDDYEVTYRLHLDDASWLVKQRHSWRGSSVFNPTHGIEVGWQRGSCEFDIGVGGHTHIGTTCRPFFRHGEKKYAVLIGTYSRNGYGRELGLAPTVGTGCGAMIFQQDGRVTFFEDLQTASEFLTWLNQ